jgi:ArsR family transcriptional regulator
MKNSYEEYASIFKVLVDETRLEIMEMLCCGEMCACKILEPFNITQPTLSYHMKVLTECRIVVSRREGSWMKYSINKEKVELVKEYFDYILSKCDNCIYIDTKKKV